MSIPLGQAIEWYDGEAARNNATIFVATYRNWRIYSGDSGLVVGVAYFADGSGSTLLDGPGLDNARNSIDQFVREKGEEAVPPLGGEVTLQPPPPTTPYLLDPRDMYASSHQNISVFLNYPTGTYYFYYGQVLYEGFLTFSEAFSKLDTLVEEAPGARPTVTVSVPSGWSWLGEVFGGLGTALNEIREALQRGIGNIGPGLSILGETLGFKIDKQSVIMENVGAAVANVGPDISSSFFGALGKTTDGLKSPIENAAKVALDQALEASSPHSPDPEMKEKLEQLVEQLTKQQKEIADTIHHSEADVAGAPNASATVAVALLGVSMTVELAGALLDILHPIKKVGAQRISERIIDSIGGAGTVGQILQMPTQFGLIPPLQKYYNSIYQPEIPSYQDMIEMVVKEVITVDVFKEKMKLLGYSEDWSQKIWDKHFIPPTLTDILTAWRRGLITEKRADELMILVDLDPRFKQIFDTRKYVDPPLNMVRFMFETGNINAEQVKEQVHLLGYRPEHEDVITNYIVEFQTRLWRRRYLVSLSQGFQKGVYTQEQLEQAVAEAEYTPDVAKYIIANALTRREIEGSTVTEEKPKLLSVADLKQLYFKNHITGEVLRMDLLARGYTYDDTSLLIAMLDDEKVVVGAGGSKVALSVAELIDAWRYEEITEDSLRITLQLKGMSEDEINILINTKKKKWGVGGIA